MLKKDNLESIKIKPLTKEQLIISFDRLTRFKEPEIKYVRVFSDVLSHNLIYPKFKRQELTDMDYKELTKMAEYVINFSIESLGLKITNDFSINKRLLEYENSVFKLSNGVKNLLENKIQYSAIFEFIDSSSPKNLQWLKNLESMSDIEKIRKNQSLRFPISKVVIAEGATEEVLLPEFAKLCGYDFDKEGVFVMSAGGKSQVVKLFYRLSEVLKLPIFVLLDKDAKENLEQIRPKLRPIDKMHLLNCGEFEDLLALDLVKRTLEEELKNISILEQEMFDEPLPRVKILEEVFKTRGRHEFKKVEFAQMVKKYIDKDNDITPEIAEIIEEIKTVPDKK
jgi:hypothetical protein